MGQLDLRWRLWTVANFDDIQGEVIAGDLRLGAPDCSRSNLSKQVRIVEANAYLIHVVQSTNAAFEAGHVIVVALHGFVEMFLAHDLLLDFSF